MSRTNELSEAQAAVAAELLRSLYDGGMSQAAIADQLSVSRRTVMRWMKRYGITTRRPGEKAA